jgi:16S rRNA (guanine527-N7)-methyltransferase
MDRQSTSLKLLKEGGEKLGISLSSWQIKKFTLYLEELKIWNKKINLTALKSDEEIVIKHFLDSLSLSLVIHQPPENLVDIGPGAGFPSLPLKIFLPRIECTLIESSGKKVKFLQHLVKKLNLEGVTLIKARAEEVARGNLRESFDLAVGRAVAKLNVLLEYTLPYLKAGGYLVAQRGKTLQEIELAEGALSILGGEIREVKWLSLPFSGEPRSLILIQKVRPTPLKYPRRPGIPGKRPL